MWKVNGKLVQDYNLPDGDNNKILLNEGYFLRLMLNVEGTEFRYKVIALSDLATWERPHLKIDYIRVYDLEEE